MHDETLIRFELGELSVDEALEVGSRLHKEPELSGRLNSVRALLAVLSGASLESPGASCVRALERIARPDLLDRLAEALGRAMETLHAVLVYDTRVQPALAGLRGHAEAVHIAYEAEGVDAHLRVTPTEVATRRLTGQVVPLSGGKAGGMAAIASLTDREASIRLIPLDEGGLFTIELPIGRYALAARCGERDLDLGDLEIT